MKVLTNYLKESLKPHPKLSQLESYFKPFRDNIIGINKEFTSPYGTKKIIYADWTASGRLYQPIEEKISQDIGSFVANTHTETSITGSVMTYAYHEARQVIKKHVNATSNDILITAESGMTGAINKFQRILGLKLDERFKNNIKIQAKDRPVVFVTHMEHHSNHTSWLETIADVEIIPPNEKGLVCLANFKKILEKYKERKIKIASITAGSNVTGITTPYHKIASMIHSYNGWCFVDFACSAPYVSINMHPAREDEYLDAIFFSPHKFLGGPGASGVLIFNKKLYGNLIPDNPGGGTVNYTNPWGEHDYITDVETREDGGTPGFLQTIRIALVIRLKEKMGVENILSRENEINSIIFKKFAKIKNLKVLAREHKRRLGVISFLIEGAHYNLVVKLLNDRFGIQTRGGCSCAGTYGHYLLKVDKTTSKNIEQEILKGSLLERPGWIRMSIHPTMTNNEIHFICDSIKEVARNFSKWRKDYHYNFIKNEFVHNSKPDEEKTIIQDWFEI